MAGNRVISAVLTLKDKNFSSGIKKSSSATKNLERKVKYAGNTVSQFSRTASSGFKNVAASAAGLAGAIGITRVVSGGINMVKNSLSSAMDRIDVMEGFERVMTTLTGSTEKTKAALEATRNAVTGTAYGMDVAAKGVQDFVTRGMDVEKATDTIAAWGDAVAFYGDGSNEQLAGVSDALAKMYSSGKVGMDQMNRLYDAGIDGVGMYAKAVGRDAASVQKDLSGGKISAADFIDVVSKAMMEGTNGVVNISGAAKEAGASWSGSFANMRAAVTRGTTSIIESIDEMLTSNGFPDMRAMVADFGGKFESTLNKAAGAVPAVSGAVVGMYTAVKPGLDWLKNTAFPAVKDEIVNMYTAAQPGLNWMKDVAFPGIVDGVVFAVDSFTSLYNFVSNNLPAMTPVIAGVVATVASFKAGVVAVTTAQSIWRGVTNGVQIATALLNGTLAISPLGWVALAIGGVVTAGILLWQNWDTVKEKAQLLWDKTKAVGTGIKIAFSLAFNSVKSVASTALDFVIGKINTVIGTINKIPGIKVPTVSRGGDAAPATKRGGPQASFAVGTNRVREDMVAQIHKDEMIIPATQSHNLRKQGVTIDNIDKGGLGRTTNRTPVRAANDSPARQNNVANDGLLNMLAELIQLIKNMPKGDVYVQIDGHNKSVTEIVNELIPLLKLRIANM